MAGRVSSETLRRIRLLAFDFDGVFTDNTVYTDDQGRESVRCHKSDGYGIRALEAAGIRVAVITNEWSNYVRYRAEKLNIRLFQTGHKLSTFRELIRNDGFDPREAGFVGNDVNDLECMKNCALPIAVADAVPEVKEIAMLITGIPGGQGVIRDVARLMNI